MVAARNLKLRVKMIRDGLNKICGGGGACFEATIIIFSSGNVSGGQESSSKR